MEARASWTHCRRGQQLTLATAGNADTDEGEAADQDDEVPYGTLITFTMETQPTWMTKATWSPMQARLHCLGF